MAPFYLLLCLFTRFSTAAYRMILGTSDAHEGLNATLNASPWQRCQFHLQLNAQAYIPKVSMRQQVADDIRYIYNSRKPPRGRHASQRDRRKHSQSTPDLARWMENAIPEGLTIFAFPENIRRRLRTSNMCETLNTQIKRRTRVAGLFPNEASILRHPHGHFRGVGVQQNLSSPDQ